jgi:serine/threonine protein kinase/Tfp pilus assembly protein PilF
VTESDRFRRVSEVFERVRALDGADRTRALDDICADDADLRREVEELLAHHDDPSSLLDHPAVRVPGSAADVRGVAAEASAPLPDRIGRYRIIRVLGEGGMGVVYLAEQDNPKREVALKVIRAGVASAEALRRFSHEAEILARLQHPGIASIYEAGTASIESGSPRPFFAMEFVRGTPLTEFAKQRQLSTRERLELIIRLCDAVQHAHQKGVIHRDLKPGNILVTDAGEVKILDFGVARVTGSDVQVTTMRTDVGQLIGTLPYMSPEQVAADPNALDTRSDVYALGVLLFELLAGRLPYDLNRRLLHEAARVIREEEPTRLSAIDRSFRGDVETIVGRALEKDRTRRYQSISDFAGDLRHFLRDEPIVARPPSATYQLRKFAKRNKGLVAGAAAIFLVLVGAIVAVSLALVDANQANREANNRLQESLRHSEMAQSVNTFLQEMLASASPTATDPDIRVRDVLSQAAERLSNQPGDPATPVEVTAALHHTIGRTFRAIGLLPEAEPHLREAVRLRRALDRTDEAGLLDLAAALDGLADALRQFSRAAEAEPLSREAIEIRRRFIKPDDVETADYVNNLGLILKEKGDYASAETAYREALTIKRAVLPPGDIRLAVTLMNLGLMLYFAHGDVPGATAMVDEATDISRAVHGPDHPYIAHCLAAKATLLQASGDLRGATAVNEECLEMRQRVFEGDHIDIGLSLNNLGLNYKNLGDYEKAERYYTEALAMRRRLLGDRHPEVATTMANFGMLYVAQRRFADAEPLMIESLAIRREALGEKHPFVAFGLNSLAAVQTSLGKTDEAEANFRAAIALRNEVLGPDHLDNAPTWVNLGILHRGRGELDEAERCIRRGIEIRLKHQPPGHPDAALARWHLASTLLLAARPAEAEQELRASLEARRAALPAGHPEIASTLTLLAVAMLEQNRAAEAEAAAGEGAGLWRAVQPPRPLDLGDGECVLGACLLALGRVDEAIAMIEAGLERLASDPTGKAGATRRAWVVARVAAHFELSGDAARAAEWRARARPPQELPDDAGE